LVTADSLRADVVFENIDKLPNFKKLANEGLVFRNAFSNSSTTVPSLISLHTSTYPNMFGGFNKGIRKRKTLAQILNKLGYKTFGINTNALVEVTLGFEKGFDIFLNLKQNYGTILLRKLIRCRLTERADLFLDHFKYAFNEDYIPSVRGELLVETIRKILKNQRNNKSNKSPVFLWCHFMDSHHPYKPPFRFSEPNLRNPLHRFYYSLKQRRYTTLAKKSDREIYLKLYFGTIKYLDYCIGKLFELFNDNWIIIVTSDHGEEFWEHGGCSHSRKLYDELIHVPLVIYGPVDLEIEEDFLLSHVHLAPTILDVLKISTNYNKFLMGKSIQKLDDNNEERYVFAEHDGIRAIRTNRYKLIIDKSSKTIELYDLKTDPKEKYNIFQDKEDVANDLFKILGYELRRMKRYEAMLEVARIKDKMFKM